MSCNPFHWRKFGSVGLPAIGMEVKIDASNPSDDGEILATLYTNKKETLQSAGKRFLEAFSFSDIEPMKNELIYKVV